MSKINTSIGASLMKFTFSDSDGDVIASFRMNPADIKLAQRCQEVSAYFETLQDSVPDTATLEDAIRFNQEMEEKICYLLGYDVKGSLFGQVSATSIMADGNLFVTHVVNKSADAIGPEINKRKQSMEKAVEKHTAKYQ